MDEAMKKEPSTTDQDFNLTVVNKTDLAVTVAGVDKLDTTMLARTRIYADKCTAIPNSTRRQRTAPQQRNRKREINQRRESAAESKG